MDQQLLLRQRYRIRLCAQNLPTKRFQPPDTFAVVTTIPNASSAHNDLDSGKPNLISDRSCSIASIDTAASATMIRGRTEVISRSRHPQYTSTIPLDVYPGSKAFFYVHIFDHEKLESFGTVLFHVADILSNPRNLRVKRLRSGGCLFCRLEKIFRHDNVNLNVHLQFQAKDIKTPHSSFELAKQSEAGWLVIYRSPAVYDSDCPTYDPFQLYVCYQCSNDVVLHSFCRDLESLCGSDPDRHLRCSIYSVNRRGKKRKLLGITETTFRHMRGEVEYSDRPDEDDFDPHTDLQLVKNCSIYTPVGRLKVLKARMCDGDSVNSLSSSELEKVFHVPTSVEVIDLQQMAHQPMSFKSYLEQGLQLDFCVAIDFTSSNGNPMVDGETSYHFLNHEGDSMNDYEETIAAIGPAIDKYSSTREYPVWGFGAKFEGVVRDIFQCGPESVAKGVDGILQSYRSVFLQDLIMSGPTSFCTVIQMAAARAAANHKMIQERKIYTVLLVITDGCMHNYDQTRQMIHEYSSLPLSIVFVGVGRSDFGLLHRLTQEPCARQATCVAEFRKLDDTPTALGEAALGKLPSQICEYMQANGL